MTTIGTWLWNFQRDPDIGLLHWSGPPGLTQVEREPGTIWPGLRPERFWNISMDLPIEDHPDVSVIRETWEGASGSSRIAGRIVAL